jgi:predicted HTH domain antitoxin
MIWSADWTFSHLTKLHKQQAKLVDDALQRMIESNPDLAWSLVVSAYLDKEINPGKAAEMLAMHELQLRARFIELGTPLRVGPTNKAEARAEAKGLSLSGCGGQTQRPFFEG